MGDIESPSSRSYESCFVIIVELFFYYDIDMKLYGITDGNGIGTRLLTAVIVQIKTAIIF